MYEIFFFFDCQQYGHIRWNAIITLHQSDRVYYHRLSVLEWRKASTCPSRFCYFIILIRTHIVSLCSIQWRPTPFIYREACCGCPCKWSTMIMAIVLCGFAQLTVFHWISLWLATPWLSESLAIQQLIIARACSNFTAPVIVIDHPREIKKGCWFVIQPT